ncbi:MAG: hypothetical protein BMS9Abin11_1338 [Gammaproteobacteria bacterium]|nr:MAG: hypothetical protein BMS9Abin11_1338 [Gammaproteobacteria bacterium]
MKKIVWVVIAVTIVVAGFMLYPRGSDEQQIRNIIKAGAQAIEEKQLGDTLKHVSRKYKDKRGLSYLAIRTIMIRLFAHYSEIDINYSINKLEITGDRATADLSLTVVIVKDGKPAYLLGKASKPGALTLLLKKSGLDWEVIEVKNLELSTITDLVYFDYEAPYTMARKDSLLNTGL